MISTPHFYPKHSLATALELSIEELATLTILLGNDYIEDTAFEKFVDKQISENYHLDEAVDKELRYGRLDLSKTRSDKDIMNARNMFKRVLTVASYLKTAESISVALDSALRFIGHDHDGQLRRLCHDVVDDYTLQSVFDPENSVFSDKHALARVPEALHVVVLRKTFRCNTAIESLQEGQYSVGVHSQITALREKAFRAANHIMDPGNPWEVIIFICIRPSTLCLSVAYCVYASLLGIYCWMSGGCVDLVHTVDLGDRDVVHGKGMLSGQS